MGKVLIYLVTIICAIVGLSTFRRIRANMKYLFKWINDGYLTVYKRQAKWKRYGMNLFGVLSVIFATLITYERTLRLTDRRVDGEFFLLFIGITIVVLFLIYLVLGILFEIVIVLDKIVNAMRKTMITTKILVSFGILAVYLGVALYSAKEIKECIWVCYIGLMISYILNIQVLMKIVSNPMCFLRDSKTFRYADKHQQNRDGVIIILGAIFVLCMLILNLYLAVIFIRFSSKGAYLCSSGQPITNWSLFYYTVISFTTIGYGDIVPTNIPSQFMAIVISVTSVLCLIIFMSSILGIKDKLSKQGEES
ncbi:Ion channel family [Lachnospiraceae bacterium KM106-2]|nr:Ion channel family [Lachnospiraceae bacterium KM106-2]